MATAAERETTVTMTDADTHALVWTAQRTILTALRRKVAEGRCEQTRTGFDGTTEWAEFRISRDVWNPVTGFKRRLRLSEQGRAELSERARRSGLGTK